MKWKCPFLLLVSLLLFDGSSPALAALGSDVSSIQQDAVSLGAPAARVTHLQTPNKAHYSRFEISRQWIRLREFVGPKGQVFALAWRGTHHPDLHALLGKHLHELQAAIGRARRQGRRGGAVIFDSSDIHVEIGGRMNAVYGSVWLKDRIPAGMNLNEIR